MKKPYDISVILPTYNERENIITLIKKINYIGRKHKLSIQCIVVDDNSSDGTVKKLDKLFQNDNLEVFVRKNERGLATAILYGIKKSRGNIIVVMDTDLNHDPKLIPHLLIKLKKHSIVVGSRFIKDGGMDNYWRYLCSKLYNRYFLSIILQSGIHDNLSGYYAIAYKDLRPYLTRSIFIGYGDYFMKLIYSIKQDGLSIYEVPCYYKDRKYGESKSRFGHMLVSYTWEAIKYVFSK